MSCADGGSAWRPAPPPRTTSVAGWKSTPPDAPPTRYLLEPGAILTYANSMLPFDDLRLPHGARLDAVLAPEQTVQMAIRSGYPIRALPGVEPFREPLTIITDKGDPAWTLRIRGLIAAMRADGALRAIALKWYGRDYSR
jgi:polar amino acid transport system substrate-binding protein